MNTRLAAALTFALAPQLAACDDAPSEVVESELPEATASGAQGSTFAGGGFGTGPLARADVSTAEHLTDVLYKMNKNEDGSEAGSWRCMQAKTADGAQAFLYLYSGTEFKVISADEPFLNLKGKWHTVGDKILLRESDADESDADEAAARAQGRAEGHRAYTWEGGVKVTLVTKDHGEIELEFQVATETDSEHEPEDPDALLLGDE